MSVFLSAIAVLDDLPYLDRMPWRESVASTLRFVDEMIVVHGGKTQPSGRSVVRDHFEALGDARVRFLTFPWPVDFDWRQIARSCTFGHLHARGDWCFRVLADEVFPDDVATIRRHLKKQPASIKIVSVDRLYLLGNRYACPHEGKPLFFRNDRTVGYGTVNPAQGDAASYLLFDDPVETDRWYDGRDVVSIQDRSILRDPKGLDRLLGGETPRGYRGPSTVQMMRILPMGILNVDVNHYPDDVLLEQKNVSQHGYQRLPPEYPHRPILSPEAFTRVIEKKIRGMIRSGKLLRVEPPEALHAFIDRHDAVTNRVRRICEQEFALPWNRVAPSPPVARRAWTLASNTARRRLGKP